jgi:hypothetical protein
VGAEGVSDGASTMYIQCEAWPAEETHRQTKGPHDQIMDTWSGLGCLETRH